MSNYDVGNIVHYRDNNGVCHPAVSNGGDNTGMVLDLVQLDSVNLGVVVPTMHTNITVDVPFNGDTITNGHCHYSGNCPG